MRTASRGNLALELTSRALPRDDLHALLGALTFRYSAPHAGVVQW